MKPKYQPGDKVVFTIKALEEKMGGGIAGYTLEPCGYFVPIKYQDRLVKAEERKTGKWMT